MSWGGPSRGQCGFMQNGHVSKTDRQMEGGKREREREKQSLKFALRSCFGSVFPCCAPFSTFWNVDVYSVL